MAAQLITYDLISPGQDYTDLHEAIKSFGSWWHCLESTWIVDTGSSTGSIRDTLKQHIDANDKLLVAQLESHWASMHLTDDCNKWLKEHVGA
jgi:hypothetical protein